MPTYRVTAPDGRVFNITGDRPPTEAELPSLIPPIAATGQATSTEEPRTHTALETTLGVLNTVPRQVMQAAETGIKAVQGETTLAEAMKKQWAALSPHSTVTGETPLAALGMAPGALRTGLGLVAEVATPMGLPAKIGKAVGLGATAAKAAANPLGAAIGVTAKGAKMIPGVQKGLDTITKPFVQYQGMEKLMGASGVRTAKDYFRLFDSEVAGGDSASRTALGKIMGDMTEADKIAMANFMAKPKKYAATATPEIQARAAQLKTLFSDLKDAEIAQGILGRKHAAKNYFPQVRTTDDSARHLVVDEMVATDRHAKKKTLSWEKHLATNKAVDPMTAAQVRLSAGNRALKTNDFLHLMAQEFGQNLKIQPLREGFRRLDLRNLKVPTAQQEVLKTLAFPKEIAEALEKGVPIMADPTGWRKTMKGVNLAFKTAVTQFNPAFHANNLQGNAYMMHLGGMNPWDIVQGYTQRHHLYKLMGDHVTPTELAALRAQDLGGQATLKVGEAYDLAAKYNLFGSSEAMIDFNRSLAKAKPGRHPVGGKIADTADSIRFTMSRQVEDPARWALFKDQLLKGKSPEDAILHVKKHLFDYAELTDVEKGIRDYGMMPFYSWLRKNTELHLGQIGEGSNRLRQAQTLYTAPGRFGDPDGEVQQAEWQREEGYQPLNIPGPIDALNALRGLPHKGFKAEMDDDGNVPLMRLANPGLDINKITSPLGGMVKSGLGPIPQMLFEGIGKHDLRTDAKILDTDNGYATASPLGTLAATIEAKTGIPMPRFGTIPNEEGTGMIQPEKEAFIMSQIPMPLVSYAQRLAGAPGETFGSQLQSTPGQILKEIILRSMGATTRKLTPEQQDAAVEALIKKMFAPEEQQLIKEQGEEMLRSGAQ